MVLTVSWYWESRSPIPFLVSKELYLTKDSIDIFIWPVAAHLSFYYGLYGTLQEGSSATSRIKKYKITQSFLCLMWFVFAIISSGSQNGWARFSTFSECETVNLQGVNSFGFSKFLTIVEIALYYASMILGIYCIRKLATEDYITSDPFEEKDPNINL